MEQAVLLTPEQWELLGILIEKEMGNCQYVLRDRYIFFEQVLREIREQTTGVRTVQMA